MTIILFLIDTSASMNQRTYMGTSTLDVTKAAVETFMKFRQRDQASRWDRYMLLTFEDPPSNIKAGWKEGHATFVHELKNLQANGLTNLGPALRHAFDLLNTNRMQSGIDTYGMGRCPFYMEPAVIICLTDGRKLTSNAGVPSELNLPMHNAIPGAELTKEPFRWDQRLFGCVLRIPAVLPRENTSQFIPPAEDSAIDAMCEVTGGRSYLITSQRTLMQCIESLVQKTQSGVVIHLEKTGPDPSPVNADGTKAVENGLNGTKENQDSNKANSLSVSVDQKARAPSPGLPSSWHACRKLIYVQRSAQKGVAIGHWPIPENFWPDITQNTPNLPPRDAHPNVKFNCTPCEPMIVDNFPFDKYELEPSPLTQYILERRQPNVCWQVFVTNSAKYSDIGHPFGYLKASNNLLSVKLFVMPYNYPVLLPLLEDLVKVHKMKVNQKWRQQFDNYLKTMPVYYAGPLRRALQRMGAPNLVPESLENCLSYSVVSHLKKLKNMAKLEYERLVASVGLKTPQNEGIKVTPRSKTSIVQRKDFQKILQHVGGDLTFMSNIQQELNKFDSFTVAVKDRQITPQMFRNPFDIPRKGLLDQIARMRANFLQSSPSGPKMVDADQIHSVPVQQMGNYQEYLKRVPQPLREIETQPVRLHTFGNPFKVDKNLMIDEADEAMPGQVKVKRPTENAPLSPGPRKRKPGPLPKDILIRRPITPPVTFSPPATPPVSKESIENEEPSPETATVNNVDTSTPIVINSASNDHSESKKPKMDITVNDELEKRANSKALNNNVDRTDVHNTNESKAAEYNVKLKRLVVNEVKRPGKNFDKLFSLMNKVQGSLHLKRLFVHDIIREALRFKRKTLAQMLKQFEQSLVRTELKRPAATSSVSSSSSTNSLMSTR